jgi:hypothetical protein
MLEPDNVPGRTLLCVVTLTRMATTLIYAGASGGLDMGC